MAASRLCVLLGALVAASSIALVALAWSPLPIGDQWYEVVSGRTHDLPWFFALHNEHRLALPRLVFLADAMLDAERNRVDLAINLLLLSGTAALMAALARRAGAAAGRARGLAFAGLALGLFSAAQSENLVWGFQVQFFGVCLLAVAAFAALALARPRAGLVAAALLSAAAAYTLSSGLLVGFVAAGLALRLGRPRGHALILALVALALLASYLPGYHGPAQTSSPDAALAHPLAAGLYLLAELGAPVATLLFLSGAAAVPVAALAGAAGLVLFGAEALRRRPARAPARDALLAVAGFCAGFAGLTALGRWGFGPAQAFAGRYETPMLLFWFGLVALRAPRPRPGARDPLPLALAALLALILANQPRFALRALRFEALEAAAAPAVLADVADARALAGATDRPPDAALDEAAALRRAGASVFADPRARLLGLPLAEPAALAALPACAGTFDAAEPVGAGPRAGWSAAGRLDGTGRFRGRALLAFADPDGRVVGYGVAGLNAAAAGAPAGDRAAVDGDRWRGDFRAADPAAVAAYALDAAGRPRCGLGRAPPETPR